MAKKLSTPSDLPEKGRKEIAQAINPLVADAFALYVKTKSFHWHLTGPHFRDYHLLFDEQAAQIFEMIDTLAERLRKLGEPTISSVNHIKELTNVKDAGVNLSAPSMLRELMHDNKGYTARMRQAHKVCEKHDDIATTSLLEIFIDETEKRTWFLSAALQ